MGWHSLPRKFATELKHIPLTDRCELGRWKTAEAMLMCYRQPDQQTVWRELPNRRCVEEARPLLHRQTHPIGEHNWRAVSHGKIPSAIVNANGTWT